MNTPTEQTIEWRWHRQDEKHKSHLMYQQDYVTRVAACGYWRSGNVLNGDMSDPCKRCSRASAGLNVGRG